MIPTTEPSHKGLAKPRAISDEGRQNELERRACEMDLRINSSEHELIVVGEWQNICRKNFAIARLRVL